jgi:hypothetical protein
MTDKSQTRPLVREGAPHGQDSNFQTRRNIDRLTNRQSQCDFDFDLSASYKTVAGQSGREHGSSGIYGVEAVIRQ